jgi:hypothetical protein
MLEPFLNILSEVSTGLTGSPEARFALAGHSFGIRAQRPLLEQMTAALQPLETSASSTDQLAILAWKGDPSPLRQAPPEWKIPERWARREPVRASRGGGMVYFDPIGGVVSLYHSEGRLGGMWFEDEAAPALWIAAAPCLRLLDAWFTEHGKFLCHGAAIARHGGAALIIGPGGVGKSTLAIRSLEDGFDYLGDDYVLLEAGPPWPVIHSIYASGKLAGADISAGLPRQATVFREPDDPTEKGFLRIAPTAIVSSARLALVIQPCIGAHDAPSMVRISAGDALRAILPSALRQLPGGFQEKLAVLTRVLTVPCFRLHMTTSHRHNLSLVEKELMAQRPSLGANA